MTIPLRFFLGGGGGVGALFTPEAVLQGANHKKRAKKSFFAGFVIRMIKQFRTKLRQQVF